MGALTLERGYTLPAAGGTYRPRVVSVEGARLQGSDRRTQRAGDDGVRSNTRRVWGRQRSEARAAQREAARVVRGQ